MSMIHNYIPLFFLILQQITSNEHLKNPPLLSNIFNSIVTHPLRSTYGNDKIRGSPYAIHL